MGGNSGLPACQGRVYPGFSHFQAYHQAYRRRAAKRTGDAEMSLEADSSVGDARRTKAYQAVPERKPEP